MNDADRHERDTGDVIRFASVAVVALVIVAFVIDNTRSVKVGFVVTDKHPPLIFVLLVTLVLGAVLDRLVIWSRRR
jgi:uncharacterized integral membrane protein